ncbi:GPN-loop GTPase 3 [Anthophora plagiata]
MRYAQLVMGPAGSGKSTYCSAIQQHAANEGKVIEVVNLDPAAEYFNYEPLVDIRELIQLDDAMEDDELRFGPNGGLVFCMEYLLENSLWLEEKLGDVDDDYIIFDCPDSQFMVDGSKFLSGTMAALSVMINLELPHINILSKMDLLSKNARKQLDKFLEPDPHSLLADMEKDSWNEKYRNLTEAIGRLIEDYSLVRFYPLNIKDDESIADIKLTVDNIIQYGEDADVKVRDFDEPVEDDKDENYDAKT